MNVWIPVTKTLPPDGKIVEVKLVNGHIRIAEIFENEYNENVWRVDSGKIAHLQNYTDAEMKKFHILTKPNIKAPVAWRRISK